MNTFSNLDAGEKEMFLLLALALLWISAYFWWQTSTSHVQVACTDEALQCPDGTFVGRTGPYCEFVCPSK